MSGVVTYLGELEQTGPIRVSIHEDVGDPPVGNEDLIQNGEEYTISIGLAGSYYIGAFLDINENSGPPDPGEPFAWYDEDGDGLPDLVSIVLGDVLTDYDITLIDPMERVSLFPGGDGLEEDHVDSVSASISGDGRVVAFETRDEFFRTRVYVHDRDQFTTEEFSTNDYFFGYYQPDISADGKFVAAAYRHQATEQPPVVRLFIKEWGVEPENLIVIYPPEVDHPYFSSPSLSGDGCRVAFELNYANSLDETIYEIYLYDCDTDLTSMISVAPDGTTPSDGKSFAPDISDDGKFIAFYSDASNLLPSPLSDGDYRIYVREIDTGETELIPLPAGLSGSDSYAPSLSADGRFVAFEYDYEIFVHDRDSGETIMISLIDDQPSGDSEDPAISGDGHFVTFLTYLQDANEDWFGDIYIHDMETSQSELVTRGFDGIAEKYSEYPAISADGNFIAFESEDPLLG